MHKRIEPHQVELGMFIHKLEGRWRDHPFWRVRFLLEDQERLDKLRASAVSGVIIDTTRGRDVARTTEGEAPQRPPNAAERLAARNRPPAPAPVPPAAVREIGKFRSCPPQSLAREFGQAVAVADRSRKTVSRAFLKMRLGKGFKTSMVEPVIEDIFSSASRNAHAFHGILQCRQDNEPLFRHALATSALMISLARYLQLPPEQLRDAGLAGLMLDVGMTRLPGDEATMDPALLATHIDIGMEMCTGSDLPEAVLRALRQHHERIDGKGYPARLRRSEISLLGRMAAICDAFDHLANGIGGTRLDPAAAIEAMAADDGAYDAELLAAFTATIGVYPVGAVVLLQSGRLAMVIDQHPAEPSLPRVVSFYSAISSHKLAPELVDLATCGTDRIEATAAPESYGIPDFDTLREKLFFHACTNLAA